MEYLEDAILTGTGSVDESRLDRLLVKLQELTGIKGPASIVSSACASSSTAIAMAASAIHAGESDCALVVAVDCVTEFVFAGFSSLGALAPEKAQPFDINRKGLSLGEGAAIILLMSEERAKQEKRNLLGQVAGWGLTSDANHMTGPSRDGRGLSQAIGQALQTADVSSDDIFSICAHGTGTRFNDAMEITAFESIFKRPLPAYSIKGGCGHLLGAAGLVETIIAMKSAETGMVPPTVNLQNPEPSTSVFFTPMSGLANSGITLSTNSGFGGVNSALIVKNSDHLIEKSDR
jgi:3-oxoacyl-[acyl-carrier-protein] synthase II